MRWARRSSNWTSFSAPWARAWDSHEVVDLAVGRLALHDAEENRDEVLAALDDKTEAVIRALEAQHTEARRSRRRRRDRARGPPTRPRERTSQDRISGLARLSTGQVASVGRPTRAFPPPEAPSQGSRRQEDLKEGRREPKVEREEFHGEWNDVLRSRMEQR
jgi:hypothetical protein